MPILRQQICGQGAPVLGQTVGSALKPGKPGEAIAGEAAWNQSRRPGFNVENKCLVVKHSNYLRAHTGVGARQTTDSQSGSMASGRTKATSYRRRCAYPSMKTRDRYGTAENYIKWCCCDSLIVVQDKMVEKLA